MTFKFWELIEGRWINKEKEKKKIVSIKMDVIARKEGSREITTNIEVKKDTCWDYPK